MEAVITVDVLRRAGAEVTVASVEKELQVDACHDVKIVADALINDCNQTVFDLISLPVCTFLPHSLIFSYSCREFYVNFCLHPFHNID